jgi:hypothetical protein
MVEAAGPKARVVRVMPNTPCLVGETAAAMCLGGKVCAALEIHTSSLIWHTHNLHFIITAYCYCFYLLLLCILPHI